jgi:hypothetical protein
MNQEIPINIEIWMKVIRGKKPRVLKLDSEPGNPREKTRVIIEALIFKLH